ncbi:MAG: hypothetical protein JWM12_4215, partial [Ilumatobacteraceae bacterium]|nr:hypothetical protein [Ilumatobacteraceae bacterium]
MTDRAGGRRRPADSGVTLVELLVTIAITGILMTSLSAGIVAVVRTMGPTAKRLAATQDEQNLVTWLPVDVSSTPVSSLRTAADAASGCAGGAPGVNVLLASWSETVNGTTTSYETSYRAVTEGAGMRLKRFTCKGNGALGTASAMNVSNVLAPLPAGWTAGTAPIVVTVTGVVVQVTLTQDDGRINSV